jgi:hypothetical protein
MLFIRENSIDILPNLKLFLNTLTVVLFYDFLWLYFHYDVLNNIYLRAFGKEQTKVQSLALRQ